MPSAARNKTDRPCAELAPRFLDKFKRFTLFCSVVTIFACLSDRQAQAAFTSTLQSSGQSGTLPNDTNVYLGTFNLLGSGGNKTVSTITFTQSGTITAATGLSNVCLTRDTVNTPSPTDTAFGTCGSFTGNTITFSGAALDVTVATYFHLYATVTANAVAGNTIITRVSGTSPTTSASTSTTATTVCATPTFSVTNVYPASANTAGSGQANAYLGTFQVSTTASCFAKVTGLTLEASTGTGKVNANTMLSNVTIKHDTINNPNTASTTFATGGAFTSDTTGVMTGAVTLASGSSNNYFHVYANVNANTPNGEQTNIKLNTITGGSVGSGIPSAWTPGTNLIAQYIDGAESGATFYMTGGANAWALSSTSYSGTRSYAQSITSTTAEGYIISPTLYVDQPTLDISFYAAINTPEVTAGVNARGWVIPQIATSDDNFSSWDFSPFMNLGNRSPYNISGYTSACETLTSNILSAGGKVLWGNSLTFSPYSVTGLTGYQGKQIKLRFIFCSKDNTSGAYTALLDDISIRGVSPYLSLTNTPVIQLAGTVTPSFTTTAYSINGQVNTAYTGTINFTSSDSSVNLPSDFTFAAGDAGTKTFTATFNTQGPQTLTVTDTLSSAASATATVYIEQNSSGFFDDTENSGAFKYTANGSGWDVSSAVTPPSGTYSYRQSSGTRGCYRMVSSAVKIPNSSNPWIGFQAAMDFQATTTNCPHGASSCWYDFMFVEIATQDAGFGDWTAVPLAGLHQQYPRSGILHACYPDIDQVLAKSSGTFAPYATSLPASYAGKIVKLRFSVVQVPDTVNNAYVDDIRIMPTESMLTVTGHPDPVEELSPGTVTVSAYDRNGQLLTTNSDLVTLSSDDTGMTYEGPASLISGVATFNNVKFLSGEWFLQANTSSLNGRQSNITVNPPGYADGPMTRFILDSIPNPFYTGGTASVQIASSTAAGNNVRNFAGTTQLSSTNPGFTIPNATLYSHPNLNFDAGNMGVRILNGLNLTGSGTHSVTINERGTVLFGDENIEHDLAKSDDAQVTLTAKDAKLSPEDGGNVHSGYKSWYAAFPDNNSAISTSRKLTFPSVNLVPSSEGPASLSFYWKGNGSFNTSGASSFFYVQYYNTTLSKWVALNDGGTTNYNYYPDATLNSINPCYRNASATQSLEFETTEEKLTRGSTGGNTVFGKQYAEWQLATFSLASLQDPSVPKQLQLRFRVCQSGYDDDSTAPYDPPVDFAAMADGYAIDDVAIQGVASVPSDQWTGSQTGISVTDVDHFSITGVPSPYESNTYGNITVMALDSAGSIIKNYTGTVTFSETVLGMLAGESVPANYTFTIADQGIHTFNNSVRLNQTGTRTLQVSELSNPTKLGTRTVSVVNNGVQLQIENDAPVVKTPVIVLPGQSGKWIGTFQFSLTKTSAVSTDLTSLLLTLDGTAAASDIDAVRLYFDNDTNYENGTLVSTASQSLSGSPASALFENLSGFTIEGAGPRYVHVVVDISSSASDGAIAGARILLPDDVVNSQNYSFFPEEAPPASLGNTVIISSDTSKTWVGTTTTWTDPNNWTPSGVPTSLNNVVIPAATAEAVLSGSTVVRSLTITDGTFRIANSASLKILNGNFTNTSSGSFIPGTGTILLEGTSPVQSIASMDALYNLSINKSAGSARIGWNTDISNRITFASGALEIGSGYTLMLRKSTSIPTTLRLLQAATLRMESGTVLTIPSGGTLETSISNAGNNVLQYAHFDRIASGTYSIVIESGGTINVPYSVFNHLDANGLQVRAGATIANDPLPTDIDGLDYTVFRYPASSGILLNLNAVPPEGNLHAVAFYNDGAVSPDPINIRGDTGGTTVNVETSGGTWNGDTHEMEVAGTTVNWTILPGAPVLLAFTTSEQTINAGQCSSVLSVKLYDENGISVTAGTDYTLTLGTTSLGGRFYSNSSCTTPISTITFSSGTDLASFYYRDNLGGTPSITVDETPSALIDPAMQVETVISNAGPPAKLSVSGPVAATSGACTGIFSVTLHDVDGLTTAATVDTTVQLTGGGVSQFFSENACTNEIRTLVIPIGEVSNSFYYRAISTGTATVCRTRRPSTGKHSINLSTKPHEVCAETDQF